MKGGALRCRGLRGQLLPTQLQVAQRWPAAVCPAAPSWFPVCCNSGRNVEKLRFYCSCFHTLLQTLQPCIAFLKQFLNVMAAQIFLHLLTLHNNHTLTLFSDLGCRDNSSQSCRSICSSLLLEFLRKSTKQGGARWRRGSGGAACCGLCVAKPCAALRAAPQSRLKQFLKELVLLMFYHYHPARKISSRNASIRLEGIHQLCSAVKILSVIFFSFLFFFFFPFSFFFLLYLWQNTSEALC